MNYSTDLRLAIEAAEKASEVIRTGYKKIRTISPKEGKGFVTNVDEEAENVIKSVLVEKTPYSFLGEEHGEMQRDPKARWVVDPIDGTNNFMRHIRLFSVSIALMREGKLALGVICNPISQECYVAERGAGAYCNDEKIRVSNQQTLIDSFGVLSSGYEQKTKERYVELTRCLVPDVRPRKLGAATLELCYLAQGSIDLFICSGDELWDYAAGLVIAREAGATITDWKGAAWNNTSSFICASNGKFHDELVSRIADLQT